MLPILPYLKGVLLVTSLFVLCAWLTFSFQYLVGSIHYCWAPCVSDGIRTVKLSLICSMTFNNACSTCSSVGRGSGALSCLCGSRSHPRRVFTISCSCRRKPEHNMMVKHRKTSSNIPVKLCLCKCNAKCNSVQKTRNPDKDSHRILIQVTVRRLIIPTVQLTINLYDIEHRITVSDNS